MTTEEKVQNEIRELAEILMGSTSLPASIELLNDFAYKCWEHGACEAQRDAVCEIREHYQPCR